MRVIPPTNGEIIWKSCFRLLSMNSLMMNDYWTQLFTSFKSLMRLFGDEENLEELEKRIKDIEDWLSDEYNPMTLQEAEVLMFQNMDLLSGFIVSGQMITQQDINSRLNEIKQYLNELIYDYLPHIRFTQQMQTE